MTVVTNGAGIQSAGVLPEPEPTAPVLTVVPDLIEETVEMKLVPEVVELPKRTPNLDPSDLAAILSNEDAINAIRALFQKDFDAAVADSERRLAQARELEDSAIRGTPRMVHAEDLNLPFPVTDGYLLTANSPSTGYIAWSSLHVVLEGIDYLIADGNTNLKYAWFVKPASGTSVTLQTSNTMPTLGAKDALIFVNNSGVPVSVLESSIAYAVGPGAVNSDALAADVKLTLTNLQNADIAIQGKLDGVITSYYQNDAPWPAGSPSPSGGDTNMGDIWYDANDGGAFRWTGASGSPANTWQRIADTSTAEIAAKVNTKISTYISSTAPVAPTGGFTVGDFWVDTANGNVSKRWDGSGWVTIQLGDAAISGVSGAKIGSGINASNVTTGTLTGTLVGTGINGSNVTSGTVVAARVGAGVAGAALGSATGQVGSSQIASNAVTPAKINAAFHLLY